MNRPQCPDCEKPMMRSGYGWSGKNRVQRWKCGHCGKAIQLKKYNVEIK